jgi:hypothetical protein
MAAKKKAKKKSAPSAARKQKVMGDALKSAMKNAMDAVKRTEEAKAQAELKVFAAKMIVHIAKEAGIKAPPMAIRKKVMADGRRKATKARKDAEKKVAAAMKKANAMQKAAKKKAA